MALAGVYKDHHKDMFKDVLLHEAQAEGSRLEQAVMVEPMEGNKTYFDKVGKVAHNVKSTRNQKSSYADQTFERRQVQEQLAEYATLFDREDLIKHVSNPRSELARAAVWELGRRKDEVIMDAITGNAVVTTNGSTANQALTLSVAVNNHTYDSGSGDVGLTSGKLKRAKREIAENYGIQGMQQRLICIASNKQIMNLTTENQQVSGDFRNRRPLEGPGTVDGLSGYMGIDFIEYEDVKVDASSDERIMLLTDDAIKMGVFLPLEISIDRDMDRVANPDRLKVFEAIGASRIYEEKVCEILCDPLA